ncbi:hypothetical protein C8R47DRAFT_1107096 [Mycena vitilis]|nr:hypothetical protein C8R47DRAFT_1107096 [Mycena vitilis]
MTQTTRPRRDNSSPCDIIGQGSGLGPIISVSCVLCSLSLAPVLYANVARLSAGHPAGLSFSLSAHERFVSALCDTVVFLHPLAPAMRIGRWGDTRSLRMPGSPVGNLKAAGPQTPKLTVNKDLCALVAVTGACHFFFPTSGFVIRVVRRVVHRKDGARRDVHSLHCWQGWLLAIRVLEPGETMRGVRECA